MWENIDLMLSFRSCLYFLRADLNKPAKSLSDATGIWFLLWLKVKFSLFSCSRCRHKEQQIKLWLKRQNRSEQEFSTGSPAASETSVRSKNKTFKHRRTHFNVMRVSFFSSPTPIILEAGLSQTKEIKNVLVRTFQLVVGLLLQHIRGTQENIHRVHEHSHVTAIYRD